jgi:hypothetical protein
MGQNIRKFFIVAIITLSSSLTARAATISVVPSGNPASYSVEGSGMDGVAGIQLDITYDTTSLSTPTVTQGALVAGAMLAANTTRPGFIKIAIISTKAFTGSGPIATISFASKKGSGGITSITSSMIDKNGSSLASAANNAANDPALAGTITTPGVPFSQTTQQSSTSGSTTTTTTAPAAAGTATPTYFGTVTLPADQQQRTDSQPATSPPVPVNVGEPSVAGVAEQTQPSDKPAVEAKPEETLQYVVYKGISERFKQYTGSKALPAMAALFEKKIAQTIHQEPAILLSDGKSKATLTIDVPARIITSPNFAVNGGTLVSFRQDKTVNGRWIAEVLPETAAGKVTLTIIAGAEEFEFPLTVAPPVTTALTLDERGWDRFLKEAGTDKAPLHDLNNDGVRDYLDEFIFVANYLARRTIPEKPASIPKKPEKTRSLDGNK